MVDLALSDGASSVAGLQDQAKRVSQVDDLATARKLKGGPKRQWIREHWPLFINFYQAAGRTETCRVFGLEESTLDNLLASSRGKYGHQDAEFSDIDSLMHRMEGLEQEGIRYQLFIDKVTEQRRAETRTLKDLILMIEGFSERIEGLISQYAKQLGEEYLKPLLDRQFQIPAHLLADAKQGDDYITADKLPKVQERETESKYKALRDITYSLLTSLSDQAADYISCSNCILGQNGKLGGNALANNVEDGHAPPPRC